MNPFLKQHKIFKILVFICVMLVAALILLGTCVLIKYKNGLQRNTPPEVVTEVHYTIPDNHELAVGESFTAELVVRLPWHDSVKLATADAGTGLLLLRDPEHTRKSIGWGYADWRVSVPLQCFRSGTVGGGVLHVDFFRGGDTELKLPELQAKDLPLEPGADLALAGHIKVREPLNWPLILLIAAGVLILLAVIVPLIFRKKREHAEALLVLPPWERAMLAIEELRSALQQGMFSVERAVGELTDIERHYLEQRFQLKAEHQTTSEFLIDMEHNDFLLSAEQRHNLCDFLTAADMVKFAKLPAEPVMFDRASEHARELIRSTTPEFVKKGKGDNA